MPIFAKNILKVGEQKPPTIKRENSDLTTFDAIKNAAKQKHFKQETKPLQKDIKEEIKVAQKVIKQEIEPPVQEQKYVHKEDGVLVRHINKKSHYLRDMIEDF